MSNRLVFLTLICVHYFVDGIHTQPIAISNLKDGTSTNGTLVLGLLQPEIEEKYCRGYVLKHLILEVIIKAPNSVTYIQKHIQNKLVTTFDSQYGSYLVMVTRSHLFRSFGHGAEPGYNYCMFTIRNREKHPFWEIWVQVLKIDERVV